MRLEKIIWMMMFKMMSLFDNLSLMSFLKNKLSYKCRGRWGIRLQKACHPKIISNQAMINPTEIMQRCQQRY